MTHKSNGAATAILDEIQEFLFKLFTAAVGCTQSMACGFSWTARPDDDAKKGLDAHWCLELYEIPALSDEDKDVPWSEDRSSLYSGFSFCVDSFLDHEDVDVVVEDGLPVGPYIFLNVEAHSDPMTLDISGITFLGHPCSLTVDMSPPLEALPEFVLLPKGEGAGYYERDPETVEMERTVQTAASDAKRAKRMAEFAAKAKEAKDKKKPS